MSFLHLFGAILLAALLGGGSAGLLGALVVGLRLPFLAVCTAHAALAGAALAGWAGADATAGGFVGALAGAAALAFVLRRRDVDPGTALASLFSVTLGVAFLALALGPRESVLGLLWGSLLFVTTIQVTLTAIVAGLLVAFVVAYRAPLSAMLFDRRLAATLVPESLLFAGFLILAAAVMAVNLQTVGGLLLYALVVNPALAAFRMCRGLTPAMAAAAGLGAASAVAGFAAAYLLDLPVGACIVLVSSAPVGLSFLKRPWRTAVSEAP